MKQLTLRSKPKNILKQFRECLSTESVNLKTKTGFIYLAGGILSKLEDGDHYFAAKGKWVKQ